MSKTVTRVDALKFIAERNGKLFSVEFVKRTTGELRLMLCRQGVTSHLKGGEPAYDFAAAKLIPVFDMQANDYRSIPTEGIVRIKMDGEWFKVKENNHVKV